MKLQNGTGFFKRSLALRVRFERDQQVATSLLLRWILGTDHSTTRRKIGAIRDRVHTFFFCL